MKESDGDSGDESVIYQASSDSRLASEDAEGGDMFSDEESSVEPDELSSDKDESDIEKEMVIFKGLLDEMGLIYGDVVTEHISLTKEGMVNCDMKCQINSETELQVLLAGKKRSDAVIAAVRHITAQVRRKCFPDKLLLNEAIVPATLPPEPPAKISIKKKFGMFDKLSKKVEQVNEVVKIKPKFKFHQMKTKSKDVLEMMSRNKQEAESLATRTKIKTMGRKRESMVKMAEFSLILDVSSPESSPDDEIEPMFKIPKVNKSRKLRKNAGTKASKKEGNKAEIEASPDYTPSIDEILELPDRMEDSGKTMDEVLDALDIEIADRQMKHEEEMIKVDTDIAAEKRRQEERRERMKNNAFYRDRLEAEMTEDILRRMFKDNLDYLKKIQSGEVESSRHQAYNKSCRTRHALYYTMITDPFTDDQLEWTLDEIGLVWMKTKQEQMDNNEYVWKVLLAECFIKLYMDHFSVSKKEAEKRISETPLSKTGEDSDDENSSDLVV